MEWMELDIQEFVCRNIDRLLSLEDYAENYIQAGRYLLVFDTTVTGWLLEVVSNNGTSFKMYSDGELTIQDNIGTFFFFNGGEYKLIEEEIVDWLR